MYWKVRKFTLEEMVRRHGLHVVLALSLLSNLFMAATRQNSAKAAPPAVAADLKSFGERVTRHLLDTSYFSFAQSTQALLSGELGRDVIKGMGLPTSQDEIRAQERQFSEKRQLSVVRIDSVDVMPTNAQGMIPVVVQGVVAIHSADESGPKEPVPFKFQYVIGFLNQDSSKPIVAHCDDLSGH